MAIDDTIAQLGDKIITTLDKYGPAATQLALDTSRIACVQHLLTGFACLAAIAVMAVWLPPLAYSLAKAANSNNDTEAVGGLATLIIGGIIVATGGIFLIMVFLIMGTAINLLNAYVWVGLFRPDIALAAKLLGWM